METGQLPVQSRRENINVSQSINVFAQYESTKFQWSPSYIYSQSFWVNCKRVEIERKRNDQSNAKHHHSSCAYIISHIMNAYSTITQPPVTHTHLQHAIVRSHMQYCELLIGQPRSKPGARNLSGASWWWDTLPLAGSSAGRRVPCTPRSAHSTRRCPFRHPYRRSSTSPAAAMWLTSSSGPWRGATRLASSPPPLSPAPSPSPPPRKARHVPI